LVERIFAIDQIIAGQIPVGDAACRFDANVLELALQELIAKETDPETDDSNAKLSDTVYTSDRKPCPTFVVATSARHNEGHPVLFRSYNCKGANADKCAIWQAVRCTCADPSFFRPIFIEVPPPGREYIGSHIHSNPSELALEEARRIWPSVKRFCLVSIGTGRQKSADFIEFKNLKQQPNPKSSFMSTCFRISGAQTLRKTMSGTETLKQIGEACIRLLGSAEPVHQRVQASANDSLHKFPYYRFNVEREMDSKFQEWKAKLKIHQLTANYMTEQDQQSRLNSCVQALSKPSAVEWMGMPI
jgi:hypothetical protein